MLAVCVPLAINYDLITAYNWNYEDILGCDFKAVILSNASFRLWYFYILELVVFNF